MDFLTKLLWRIGILATLGLTVATLAAFAGRFWLTDLLAHFRLQYALGLALLMVWTGIFGRLRRSTLLPLPALLINLALLAPYWLPTPAAPTDSTPLRVLTFNVLLSNSEHDAIVATILEADADIVAISELTPPLAQRLAALSQRYPWQLLEPQGGGGHYGIGLLSRLAWESAEIIPLFDPSLPAIVARVPVGGVPVTVWAVHLVPPFHPPGHALREKQAAWLAGEIGRTDTPVIVLGDLNTTPFGSAFRTLTAATGLQDSARGHGLPPTWLHPRYPLGIAIDHVLVSAEIHTRHRTVGNGVGSDHFPIWAELGVGRQR